MAIALILILLGFLLSLIGGIWGLVLAFQDSVLWGVLYLLVPFASLVFVIKKWGNPAVKKSFFLGLLGVAIAIFGAFLGGRMIPDTLIVAPDLTGAIPVPNVTMTPTDPTSTPIQPVPAIPPPPVAPTAAASPAVPAIAAPVIPNQSYDYRESMLVGYAAFEQKDYQTALINFKRAAQTRPGDSYAVKAIQNTEAVLQQAK